MPSCRQCGIEKDVFPKKSSICQDCRNAVARERRKRKGTICFRCHLEKLKMATKKICQDCFEKKKSVLQTCTLCRKEKDVDDFYKSGRLGLYRTQCKECERNKKERRIILFDQTESAYRLGQFFSDGKCYQEDTDDLEMVCIVHVYAQHKHHLHIMGLPIVLSQAEKEAFFRGYYEGSRYKESFMRIFFTQQKEFLQALRYFLQNKQVVHLSMKGFLMYLYGQTALVEQRSRRVDRIELEG